TAARQRARQRSPEGPSASARILSPLRAMLAPTHRRHKPWPILFEWDLFLGRQILLEPAGHFLFHLWQILMSRVLVYDAAELVFLAVQFVDGGELFLKHFDAVRRRAAVLVAGEHQHGTRGDEGIDRFRVEMPQDAGDEVVDAMSP